METRLETKRAKNKEYVSRDAIRDAVLSGNLYEVQVLVEKGADIAPMRHPGPYQEGNDEPITLAIQHNYYDIAEYLLKNGSNPDLLHGIGSVVTFGQMRFRYLLETLAGEANLAMLDLLTKYGADITSTLEVAGRSYSETKKTCKRLLNSLEYRDEEYKRKFLEIDSQADMHYKKAYKILFDYAIGCAFTKKSFPYLAGIDISGFNFIGVSIGGSPITKEKLNQLGCLGAENAIVSLHDLEKIEDKTRKEDLVKRLNNVIERENGVCLENGIVNLVPLCLAAKKGDVLSVKARVESGRKSNEEITKALKIAKENGHKDTISILKEYVDVNTKDKNGNNLLHLAVKKDDLEEVKRLILKGVNINDYNNRYEKPLDYALNAREINIEILKLLLNNGAEIEGNPLIIAVEKSNAVLLALLLDAMKDKNNTKIRDFIEDALFLAIKSENSIALLMAFQNHGVNLNLQDADGNTLLSLAINRLFEHAESLVFSHIRNFGCYPDGRDGGYNKNYMEDKKNVMTSFGLIQYLLRENVSPLPVNHNGYSALSLLVTNNFHYLPNSMYENLFNELIAYGANPKVVDHNGLSLEELLKCNYISKSEKLEKERQEKFSHGMRFLDEEKISRIKKEIISLNTAYSAVKSILYRNVVCSKMTK